MSEVDSTPGGRIGDDLYNLYLAGIGWLLLPMYGEALGVILPSDWSGLDQAVAVAATLVVVSSAWFGFRGAPLLVPRSAVLHQLTSSRTRRSMLVLRATRQAVAAAAIGAVAVTFLLAISDVNSFGYGEAARVSLVTIAAALVYTGTTIAWLVVFRGDPPARGAVAVVALFPPAAIAAAAVGPGLFSGAGAAALGFGVVVASALGLWALEWVPVDHLWRKAGALDAMRSAARTFDFHRVLVSLVRADAGRRHSARPMPSLRLVPPVVWRHAASARHGIAGRVVQLGALLVAAVALLRSADPSDGVIALAVASIGFIVGIELSAPVASTAGHTDLIVHYPKGSGPILRRQVATVIGLGLLGGVVIGLAPSTDRTSATSVGFLFVFGVLAAAVQARLGSPDLVSMMEKTSPDIVGFALWARALLGFVLCLAMTIAVSRAWLRPELAGGSWPSVVPVLLAGSWVLATDPIERTAS